MDNAYLQGFTRFHKVSQGFTRFHKVSLHGLEQDDKKKKAKTKTKEKRKVDAMSYTGPSVCFIFLFFLDTFPFASS